MENNFSQDFVEIYEKLKSKSLKELFREAEEFCDNDATLKTAVIVGMIIREKQILEDTKFEPYLN